MISEQPDVIMRDGRPVWVVALADREASRSRGRRGTIHRYYIISATEAGAFRAARYLSTSKTVRIAFNARIAKPSDLECVPCN